MLIKIHLTGFETFGNYEKNPTIALIKELKKRRMEDIEILVLRVGYGKDGKTVIQKMKEFQPNLVISFGLAGGRQKVCFEAMAINARSSYCPDNQGLNYLHQTIGTGDLAYESTIRYQDLEERVSSKNFIVSYHAGTFVCNDDYYQELEFIKENHLDIACGFIHIPFITEFTNQTPSMEWDVLIEIVMKILYCIMEG